MCLFKCKTSSPNIKMHICNKTSTIFLFFKKINLIFLLHTIGIIELNHALHTHCARLVPSTVGPALLLLYVVVNDKTRLGPAGSVLTA